MTVAVTSPADTQGYPTGTSITASATVVDPGAFTDTVTFHMTPVIPAGPTVDTVSTNTSSPFSAALGALPDGTYEIYATVANDDDPPANGHLRDPHFHGGSRHPDHHRAAPRQQTPRRLWGEWTVTATVSPIPTGGTVQFYDGGSIPSAARWRSIPPRGRPASAPTRLARAPMKSPRNYSGHWLHAASVTSALSQVVGKAPLTVRALNTFRAPNTANPDPFPYQITGYQNGENLATSGVIGTPTLTTTRSSHRRPETTPSPAPWASLAASNYSFTLVNGTLTVAEVADTFSVNFYVVRLAYGGMTTDEEKANVRVPPVFPPVWATGLPTAG